MRKFHASALFAMLLALIVGLATPGRAAEDNWRDGPFTYVNKEYECSFAVSAGWTQYLSDELLEDEALFFDLESDYGCLSLCIVDYWMLCLTDEEREVIDPDTLDDLAFSTSDVEYLFDFPESTVSRIPLGDTMFFFAVLPWEYDEVTDTRVEQLSFSPVAEAEEYVTELIAVNNGYFYWFEFEGTPEDAAYADVETMLASFSFSADVSRTSSSDSGASGSSGYEASHSTGAVLESPHWPQDIVWLIAAVIVSAFLCYRLPVHICRLIRRKDPLTPKGARIFLAVHISVLVLMNFFEFSAFNAFSLFFPLLFSPWNYRTLARPKRGRKKARLAERRSLNGHEISSQEEVRPARNDRKEGRRTLNGKAVKIDANAHAEYRRWGPELDGRDDCLHEDAREEYRRRGPELD